jgi:hypothetical protein
MVASHSDDANVYVTQPTTLTMHTIHREPIINSPCLVIGWEFNGNVFLVYIYHPFLYSAKDKVLWKNGLTQPLFVVQSFGYGFFRATTLHTCPQEIS